MSFRQVFDIIGPIMIGPSSSHTAGAARIGRVARQLFGDQPEHACITLYGSFARTYRGHGTDVALTGGLLGFDTFDDRIKQSLQLAKESGVEVQFRTSEEIVSHPNTARIQLRGNGRTLDVTGISIGGGAIEILDIDGFKVSMAAVGPTLAILHMDKKGVIAQVTASLAAHNYNIAHMEVCRFAPGAQALMIMEADLPISATACEVLERIPEVLRVAYVCL
ncbi:L-serine ammonia-lyase, iron-sulfur-dependent subunit beta [Fodinisporobacter ferrooxydans]|uniref:L-serine deaminase n=1 Tax=Fodinisporobacter ferrooxydans TaxID=2901836 RepID=A0ABY4CFD8_9BACL|nr:L-serine ammonia-lyase, iron-sulfur-dependent subunit beta [Alicyclobacillaceae bacterium MYW30-H2]